MIHSLLVNWCRLKVESRALTCPFKQSNLSIWSLLSWHPTRTYLWVRLSVFLKLFVSTVTVPPSDSDYVNRSASLQQFLLIHPCRARRSRSDEGGHQCQAVGGIWCAEFLEEYGVSKKWVIIMDRRQAKTAASTQAETSGSSAQDRYCARGSGGGAKKRRGNGDV